jgi:hypothetical protein
LIVALRQSLGVRRDNPNCFFDGNRDTAHHARSGREVCISRPPRLDTATSAEVAVPNHQLAQIRQRLAARPPAPHGGVMTAQLKNFPKLSTFKLDDLSQRVDAIAQQVLVIYWAASGLREVITDGYSLRASNC